MLRRVVPRLAGRGHRRRHDRRSDAAGGRSARSRRRDWQHPNGAKAIPSPRTIDELRTDTEFQEDAADAMIAVVPFEPKPKPRSSHRLMVPPRKDDTGPAPETPVRADYARDVYGWSQQQARLIREGRWTEIDRDNVAEGGRFGRARTNSTNWSARCAF